MKEVIDDAVKHLEASKEELLKAFHTLDDLIGLFRHIASVIEQHQKEKER